MIIRYKWVDDTNEIEYEYSHNVSVVDFVLYLMPQELSMHNKFKTEEQLKESNYAYKHMKKAIEYLMSIDQLDLEDIAENDEYFYQFLKERYEEDAKDDYEDSEVWR